MFVLLQDIPTFVCLKMLVILRTSGVDYVSVVHFFVSGSVIVSVVVVVSVL